jgi:hypothetical protein
VSDESRADDQIDLAHEQEIFRLVKRERLARDTGRWEELAACYWPESTVRVTWFTGTAREFAEASRQQYESGKGQGIHIISPVWARVDRDRALVESLGTILTRTVFDGVLVDITTWVRFFSRVRHDGERWLLVTFDGIYMKDRIDPVDPAGTLVLEPERLAAGRASYRHQAYMADFHGYPRNNELPGDDRRDLIEEFYAEAERWLAASDG